MPAFVDGLQTAIGDINRSGTCLLLVDQKVHGALEGAHRAYA
jgi:ABC-type branched-subunit amino acid transport system ATPase component